MAIPKQKNMVNLSYITSACQYTYLIDALESNTDLDLIHYHQTISAVRIKYQSRKNEIAKNVPHSIHKSSDKQTIRGKISTGERHRLLIFVHA